MQRKSPKKQWFVADVEFKPIKWHSTLHVSKHINPIYRISLGRAEKLVGSDGLRLVVIISFLRYRRPCKVLRKRRTKFH